LIACSNFFEISSIYKWKGKIERGKEIGILMKTKKSLKKKVIERVKELHPYKLPCIIIFEIDGDRDFLKWVSEETI